LFGRRNVILGDASDILLQEATSAITECNYASTSQRIHGFMMDVCRNLERNAEDSFKGENETIAHLIQSSETNMRLLQRALRIGGDSSSAEIVTMLKTLGESARDDVIKQIENWETDVLKALSSYLSELFPEAEEDEANIDRFISLANDTHESLSLLSSKAVKLARRKSISRRKVSVSSYFDSCLVLCKTHGFF